MDVLEKSTSALPAVRRCQLWCWSDVSQPVKWEQRTLVVGGFSFFGLLMAAGTALASASGNQRRRAAAIAAAAPGWRFVSAGTGQIVDSQLVFTEDSGIVRWFDLSTPNCVDSPQPGWLRFRVAGSAVRWSVEVR